MQKLLTRLKITWHMWKGGLDMVTVYVTLIIRGYKTFAQVPTTLQEDVRAELEALELGHLAQ